MCSAGMATVYQMKPMIVPTSSPSAAQPMRLRSSYR